MTRDEAEQHRGKMMFIVANNEDNYKAIYGRISETDRTGIWFIDNEDMPHYFKLKNIHSYELVTVKSDVINIPD